MPSGITDIVPAFGSTAVHFDPTIITIQQVENWITNQPTDAAQNAPPRTVELPVRYGGDFGSDLDSIAEQTGLSRDEVVLRHTAAEYTVGAIGFQPGFPYLEGLPTELHTHRQASPRTRVPAGSVGIGGPYTGIYPRESPGGWNLIGRTPALLFDEFCQEPSLLKPGDHVRFIPIDADEYERLAAENEPTAAPLPEASVAPLFRVVSPGVQTTIQDLGHPGQQHLGISPGGAMDTMSLRLANLLVSNPEDAPGIEVALVGPVLEALRDVTISLTGAIPAARRRHVSQGERLDLRKLSGGARAYVALPGGVAGRVAESLEAAQTIGSRSLDAVECLGTEPVSSWSIRSPLPSNDVATLRVLPGPQMHAFAERVRLKFAAETYSVSSESNRMGLRCEGPAIEPLSSNDAPSQPVCHGAIQIPPDGQPIILGADRQTLGGYPIIAIVASVDWPKLGQLRPNDQVRFKSIDLATAQQLRRDSESELLTIATGIQLHTEME